MVSGRSIFHWPPAVADALLPELLLPLLERPDDVLLRSLLVPLEVLERSAVLLPAPEVLERSAVELLPAPELLLRLALELLPA